MKADSKEWIRCPQCFRHRRTACALAHRPFWEVNHIEKVYGSRGAVTQALNDVSFIVETGEFVGIMGASGSGKSTLLNCVSTIDAVTSGGIFVDGQDVTKN